MVKGKVSVLKVLIVLAFLFVLTIQGFFLPLLASELAFEYPELATARYPTLVAAIIAFIPVQVVLVIIWQLLTLVEGDCIFDFRGSHLVDLLVRTVWVAAGYYVVLTTVLSVLGIMHFTIFYGLVAAIIITIALALLLQVMRALLAQAINWGQSNANLQNELAEVI